MPAVAVSVNEGVAEIRLDRPEALNAWNHDLGEELNAAVARVADDDAVRAVVLRGAGRAFSSGADLRDMGGRQAAADGRPDLRTTLVERYHPIILGIREMPKPVVAAVHGPAVGIGCSLALACDLVVCSESAYFLLAFVNIGLVPDGGSSAFVPARAGLARASEMAMLGERVGARDAVAWGLANRVVADDALDGEVAALAARLAAGPTRSYAATKRALNAWQLRGLDEQLELEADLQQEMAGTQDFVEGVSAFVAKRDAAFTGR